MAVNALDLRPRGTLALLDAAVRLCATTVGVWAVTLPGGALLLAAAFNLADAIHRHESLLAPVAWWTLAWALRAVSQGAACHYVDQQVLGTTPPTAWGSYRAALRRAPGLITASAVMLVINVALWLFTAGLGFLFLGAHAAGYAATMRGEGSALGVYGTAARLLGASRTNAAWVRLFGVSQGLVALNLHVVVAVSLYLARSVLGIDVAFVNRFTSLDNGTWLGTLAVVTFILFEPLRAATGALLLIDGRVRQEGLDLLASVEQLPTRRKKLAPLIASTALLLLASPAWADDLGKRLHDVAQRCEMSEETRKALDDAPKVSARDRAAYSRFVAHIERTAIDDDDCETAEADLKHGLALMGETVDADQADDPASLARDVLARPEFQQAPAKPTTEDETPPEDEAPSAFQKWWDDLWRRFWEWLRQKDDTPRHDEPLNLPTSAPSPMFGANVVMVIAVLLVAGVLVYLLLRGTSKKTNESAALDESGALTEEVLGDPSSALSRPPESWAGLADELAARGDFREAIRHLYLALLARLHRDGVIDYDPTRSNWDYVLTFKGASAVKSAFRDLTRRFDFAWYGNLEVTAPSWAKFRSTAEPILAPPREAAGA